MEAGSPACPRADHTGSRITRNGSYGPYGRQRFKCQPPDGPAHTFSVFTDSIDVNDVAPPQSIRLKSFRHSVADIARALVCIGRGASYRQAAIQVSMDTRAGGINGQLVANWVNTFGPVVAAEPDLSHWPAVISVGSFPLRRGPERDDLLVQLATNADPGESGPRLLHVQIAGRATSGTWNTFYARYAGQPSMVIVQRGSRAAAAALRRWPDPPPLLVESRPRHRDLYPADVEGHGGPDGAIDADIDAAVAHFRRYRDVLFRRLASRQSHFTNLAQLNQLVELMRLDVNGAADQATYANRILAGRHL